MANLHDDLREVMGLLGRATDGRWYVEPMGENEFGQKAYSVNMEDGRIHTVESGEFYGDPHDANAAVAVVNFLRQHGPALLARQEGEDAERLDWLDKHAVSVAYERKLSPASTHSAVAIIRHPMAEGHGTVRAFVDAARSGGGG